MDGQVCKPGYQAGKTPQPLVNPQLVPALAIRSGRQAAAASARGKVRGGSRLLRRHFGQVKNSPRLDHFEFAKPLRGLGASVQPCHNNT